MPFLLTVEYQGWLNLAILRWELGLLSSSIWYYLHAKEDRNSVLFSRVRIVHFPLGQSYGSLTTSVQALWQCYVVHMPAGMTWLLPHAGNSWVYLMMESGWPLPLVSLHKDWKGGNERMGRSDLGADPSSASQIIAPSYALSTFKGQHRLEPAIQRCGSCWRMRKFFPYPNFPIGYSRNTLVLLHCCMWSYLGKDC